MMQAIEMVSKNPNVGKYFEHVIDHIKKKQPLKEYFMEWVEMSYIESSPNQE